MAATALTIYPAKISANGAITTATPDVSNGNEFVNTGREIVLITTISASGITAAITPLAKLLTVLPVASPPYAVGASATVALGPFDPNTYNGNTSGAVVATATNRVAISWSGSSGTVTVAIVQVPSGAL